ncbi:AraC family transcriptional regulator [Winogradskyella sp.]|uniref:helix-turn-helix domain-containing protein n=1 Tax=Winogradskyella sp. TaxID=1883156 RepID=UPI00263530C3|nr:AraC family transcriptional regulator [Winogradskyella sp.]
MISEVHKIQCKKLQPFVQYILYNRHNQASQHSVTSFPNTNICLGISKGNVLLKDHEAYISKESKQNDMFVYTTGLYTTPHEFKVSKSWDEICIDFHPCGYYHFFDLPSKHKIIDEGFTSSFFSRDDQICLEDILNEPDLKKRSLAIEKLLISKLKPFDQNDLQLAVEYIHVNKGLISVKEVLRYTKCSERKMYNLFNDHFGITPKWYIRIVRIRQALKLITFNPLLSLTEVAYQCGYNDQSHFIKEAKLMCNLIPKKLKNNLISIDNEVIISKK